MTQDPRAVVRARREALFYRDLAARVPVVVPRVLGLDLDEAQGVVVLLAAYAPSPPPDRWTENDFGLVARQLGRLHAAFWDKIAALDMPAWLRTKPPVTHAQCREAGRLWRALGERDDLRDAVAPHLRRLELLLEGIPELDPRRTSFPATLCHGDCHTGNLLRGPGGEWIWADWQEVRLGPGVDDLAFFWQRAFAATDEAPPYEAMVRAYCLGLETGGKLRVTREQLDRDLAWSELRCWLVDWPRYLGFLPAARVGRVMRRIDALIEQLGGLTGDVGGR